ncbi:MAG: DNA methyltransferase [archaeon]
MRDKIDLPEKECIAPRVLVGDVFDQLKRIPDASIDCIVTSPPYWQQRDYGVENQIGLEESPEKYIQHIKKVGDELRRVLDDDGSYFLNIGDKYVDKNLQMIPFRVAIEMQKRGWVVRNTICWYKPDHMPTSVGDRFNDTWEPIFFFVKDTGNYTTPQYNFFLDRIRIPHKTEDNIKYKPKNILDENELDQLPEEMNPDEQLPSSISPETYSKLPPSLKDGNNNSDYKGKFKDAKRMNLGASPGARVSVEGIKYTGPQRKYSPDDLEVIEYLRKRKKEKGFTISEIAEKTGVKKTTVSHWFRTDRGGRCLPDPEGWKKLKEVLDLDDRFDNEMTTVHYKLQGIQKNEKGKNPGDMWKIQTGTLKEAHFSIFPEKLPERVIKAVCPEEGVVLDPFAGSGTTGQKAMELGRRSILIELNSEYLDIIEKRCGKIVVIDGEKKYTMGNQRKIDEFKN